MKKLAKISGLIWLFANAAFALSTDRNQTLQIEADSAQLDNIKGFTVYSGNVIVNQGTLQLFADKVTLTYNTEKQVESIIAEGNGQVVRFKQTLDNKEEVRAQSKKMEYFAKNDTLHLKQDAQIWRSKDTISGQHIVYDAKKAQVIASEGRVKVMIEPQKAQKISNPKKALQKDTDKSASESEETTETTEE
ncbi:MAG: lipopolysaccharide transport periplasmic protein LptA [Pseudomonadota bacterium]|jgi:lipopolysaccharide export system protein LptA